MFTTHVEVWTAVAEVGAHRITETTSFTATGVTSLQTGCLIPQNKCQRKRVSIQTIPQQKAQN